MCDHLSFSIQSKVARLTDTEDGPAKDFMLELRISCNECGLPFEFIGVRNGISFTEPRSNISKQELCLPIKPTTDPVDVTNVLVNYKPKS